MTDPATGPETGPATRTAPPRPRPARGSAPSLRAERALLRAGHPLVAGVDEVGRGALAGPVTVGVVVVTAATPSAPPGLRDSKLLTPAAREALVPRLRRWAPAWAVGHAEPGEVDALGVLRALRLAGTRALAQLPEAPEAVLLDGSYDWLTRPPPPPGAAPPPRLPAVRTRVKADLRCAAVAAASVLAKVARDAIMVERARDHPGYGWEANKGYSCAEHSDALRRLGPCAQHRRSWRLPGVEPVLFDLDQDGCMMGPDER
ncbi:ribonuclease HII [Quadrisphaera sp. DSM 44207]|uniref:ribonuclease HII n=1 Tax=Quadrisphaera sp. DSM 44207 TaxID=1881057 RepID=UPI0008832495|nr:ribonuclease HII [Quadrisphaera sp. DSM 44207]SDQ76072.1 RNase HII [Quadrisphaera sp. DSM 44207]